MNRKIINTLALMLTFSATTAVLARPYVLVNNSAYPIRLAIDCIAAAANLATINEEHTMLTMPRGRKVELFEFKPGDTKKLDSNTPCCLRTSRVGSTYLSNFYDIPINEKLQEEGQLTQNILTPKGSMIPRLRIGSSWSYGWSFTLEWPQ